MPKQNIKITRNKVNEFRQLALSMKHVEELPHFDKVSFRVNKKIFATLNEKENRATIILSENDQYIFCLNDRSVVYPVPNKWGFKGWTHIDLTKISKGLLVQILKSSYLKTSSKKSNQSDAREN